MTNYIKLKDLYDWLVESSIRVSNDFIDDCILDFVSEETFNDNELEIVLATDKLIALNIYGILSASNAPLINKTTKELSDETAKFAGEFLAKYAREFNFEVADAFAGCMVDYIMEDDVIVFLMREILTECGVI